MASMMGTPSLGGYANARMEQNVANYNNRKRELDLALAMHQIIDKWERYKLYHKRGREPDIRYEPDQWLICEMKPTIDAARQLLGRRVPVEF